MNVRDLHDRLCGFLGDGQGDHDVLTVIHTHDPVAQETITSSDWLVTNAYLAGEPGDRFVVLNAEARP